MKKLVVVALLLALVFSGWAAGPKVKVGVCIANFNDTFLMYMKDGMDKFAKTLSDIEVTYADGKEDAATQLSQVENFLSQGVDVVVVVPVNTEATNTITASVQKAGKKLVYVNRYPASLPKGVVYVGSESIQAGILQMEALGKKLGGKGNIAILEGPLDNEAALKRTEGVQQVVKQKFPNIKIVSVQVGHWNKDEGRSIMENWLSAGQKIDAIAANNDDMALGALLAIQAAGKLHKILVAGVDATPDALAEMAKGNLDITVFQNADGQGKGGIETAYNLAKGKAVKDQVWIPFELVTPENYKNYMKK